MLNELYESYYKKYEEAIKPGMEAGHEYVVKDYVWICMRFLTDRDVNPWENAKMKVLLKDLLADGEIKLIEAIERTTREFLENSEKKKGETNAYACVY